MENEDLDKFCKISDIVRYQSIRFVDVKYDPGIYSYRISIWVINPGDYNFIINTSSIRRLNCVKKHLNPRKIRSSLSACLNDPKHPIHRDIINERRARNMDEALE